MINSKHFKTGLNVIIASILQYIKLKIWVTHHAEVGMGGNEQQKNVHSQEYSFASPTYTK